MESTFHGSYDTEVCDFSIDRDENTCFYSFDDYDIFCCRKQFFIEPNDTVEIDMMYNGGNFPFYEDKSLGVKILALPYKGLEVNV